MNQNVTHGYGGARRGGTLVRAGGGLGIAACIIGLLVFVGGCLGYWASFQLGFLPAIMGGVGLVLVIVGGVKNEPVEATQVLAALVISLWGILGGLILMSVAYGWRIMSHAGGT
jgi:hypothetical protein